MMRFSTSGALRASLSKINRKSTTTTLISRAAASTTASSGHAISNPTLANIEKRWEGMPLQEQAELWMALRDRMKENWSDLTIQEKKAAYWIAFGPHGPRAEAPPDEGKKVALGVFVGVFASLVIFASTRMFAKPAPHTMNKEWQEAANEYLKEQKAEPFTGYSSPDYKGKGQVQSPPKNA
ncbi:Cytochrome c oxidase subunit 5B, mitochondrial [Gnomoniopsis sp. IMI 355080]|nr:Cytochrome c oxidase subunit 5B, mitochondrial [Gnomoniopsis sp. IMI 355080]